MAPALDELFVAEVEAVLEVQQARHQPNRQPRPPGIAAASAGQRKVWAEQANVGVRLARSILMGKHRPQRSLDLIPGQARGQHRQRIAQVDHRVDTAAKEVRCLHHQIPQK